jgi:hypothetical protein
MTGLGVAQSSASSAGLRGLLGFILLSKTGTVDTHSGETGRRRREIRFAELMQLVRISTTSAPAKIKIKGFYDRRIPPQKRAARLGKLRLHDEGIQGKRIT